MKKVVLRIFLVILLVFGVSAVSLAQDALKGAITDLDKGWQSLDIPLLEKTVKAFEDMAKKNPKDSLASYYAAKAHFAIADCLDIKSEKEFDQTGEGDKHIDAALDLIKTSLGAKEDSLDTQILKFQVLRRKMFHVSFPRLMMYISDRRAAFTRAKELSPDNLNVQLLGAIEVMDGWPPPAPEQAVAELEKLLKKDPKLAEAYYLIGTVWEKANKKDDAKKNYEKALSVDPNHHWAQKKLKGLAGSKST
jgi:tetratricopeptide (TPR) repeat protein